MSFVLFPSSPLDERRVDEEFSVESARLQFTTFTRALVDQDLLAGSGEVRTRMLPAADDLGLYRGWMLATDAYTVLHAALVARGLRLVTSPAAYARAHLLPGWLAVFEGLTPATVFVAPDADAETVRERARRLDSTGFIVKDYVKSRKHEWDTACFAGDETRLPEVVANFVALQAEFLVGEVVIRAFVPLDGARAEVRVWWAHGRPVLLTRHPDAPVGSPVAVEADFLAVVAARVDQLGAPFVTTDIAWDRTGRPLVIEVGDGQVSGMPAEVDEAAYLGLLHALCG